MFILEYFQNLISEQDAMYSKSSKPFSNSWNDLIIEPLSWKGGFLKYTFQKQTSSNHLKLHKHIFDKLHYLVYIKVLFEVLGYHRSASWQLFHKIWSRLFITAKSKTRLFRRSLQNNNIENLCDYQRYPLYLYFLCFWNKCNLRWFWDITHFLGFFEYLHQKFVLTGINTFLLCRQSAIW